MTEPRTLTVWVQAGLDGEIVDRDQAADVAQLLMATHRKATAAIHERWCAIAGGRGRHPGTVCDCPAEMVARADPP